jgi:lipopolysaccharide transport system ATP-binding protein
MSNDIVIRAEAISKRYRISHQVRQTTLCETLPDLARRAWKRLRGAASPSREDFWALRDINFEIRQGEVVGVIGRNGSGKSTLLKILSRITAPTTGRITLKGRVASLLEVGTGFHPELTGRDNIYLNGAILGMSRAEIRQKFDEIVAFAEVERFIDTPVKRYSSGMYVRLAFSVAAHLEPEILIVDEVLAVGDAAFQKKCIGKMQNVAGSGRTVLLVSHNMAVVQSLCQRVLLLESSQLVFHAEPHLAIERYQTQSKSPSFRREIPDGARSMITAGEVSQIDDPDGPWIMVRATIYSKMSLRAAFELRLHDAQGQPIAFGSFGTLEPERMIELVQGEMVVAGRFSAGMLVNGHYSLTLKLTVPFVETLDEVANALCFELEIPPSAGSSHRMLQSWGAGSFLLDFQPTS